MVPKAASPKAPPTCMVTFPTPEATPASVAGMSAIMIVVKGMNVMPAPIPNSR